MTPLPDVLSQSEIDSLLNALSSGEMDADELKSDEKKIRTYDFKRSLRFSKDQLRSLTRIFENYARLLTTHFSAQLRTLVQVSVASVDQLPYEEFISSIPKKTILNIFRAMPLEGRMVMEVNPNISYAMLDRVLGGQGISSNNVSNLTEIETMIMERTFKRAIDQLTEAFKSIVPIVPEVDLLETNSQFMQIVSPNETVAVISLNTKIGEVTGMMNLCLPHLVLEPIIPKLTAHHWFASQKKERATIEIESLRSRVNKTKLPISVDLGTSSISVNDFLQLSKGDVIRLNETVGGLLTVRVGTRPKFLAQPGTKNGKVAVQIAETIREEADEDDQ